eukprot:221864-Pleurochrysis_carterae.AAC.1
MECNKAQMRPLIDELLFAFISHIPNTITCIRFRTSWASPPTMHLQLVPPPTSPWLAPHTGFCALLSVPLAS